VSNLNGNNLLTIWLYGNQRILIYLKVFCNPTMSDPVEGVFSLYYYNVASIGVSLTLSDSNSHHNYFKTKH